MNRIEKLRSKLEEIQEQIDNLASEMQDTYDSRSERWQESEKGEEYQETIDALVEASQSVGDAVDTLSEVE